MSYLEVYNETIRDLLYDEADDAGGDREETRWGGRASRGGTRDATARKPPAIRLVDDPKRGVTQIKGIREVSVASVGDVFDTIVEGEARRSVRGAPCSLHSFPREARPISDAGRGDGVQLAELAVPRGLAADDRAGKGCDVGQLQRLLSRAFSTRFG